MYYFMFMHTNQIQMTLSVCTGDRWRLELNDEMFGNGSEIGEKYRKRA